MVKVIEYIKARLKEHSTYVGLSLAITAAAALPYPWNVFSFLAGFIGSMFPDGTVGNP